jgi:hypothetical protein
VIENYHFFRSRPFLETLLHMLYRWEEEAAQTDVTYSAVHGVAAITKER